MDASKGNQSLNPALEDVIVGLQLKYALQRSLWQIDTYKLYVISCLVAIKGHPRRIRVHGGVVLRPVPVARQALLSLNILGEDRKPGIVCT